MSGAHIVENTNNEKIEKPNTSNPTASTLPPNNNEELLKSITDFKDRIKKLEDFKLEDFEPLRKLSHFIGNLFGKSSNDTQENPKDAQKSTKPIETTELTNENTKLKTEKTELNSKITGLSAEKDKLDKEKTELTEKNKNLTTEKERLERESKNLTTEKENLNNQLNASQKQVNELKKL